MTDNGKSDVLIVVHDDANTQPEDIFFREEDAVNAFWSTQGFTHQFTLRTERGVDKSNQNKPASSNFPKLLQWNKQAKLNDKAIPDPSEWHNIVQPATDIFSDAGGAGLFDDCAASSVTCTEASPVKKPKV